MSPLAHTTDSHKKHSPAGFTLVELLLVVLIMGILVGISTPLFKNTYYDFQLTDTAQRISGLVRFAQASAIVERAKFRINFNSEKTKYWLEKESDPAKPNEFLRISGKFGRANSVPQDIKIEYENDTITFYPDGSADEAVIYFRNKNNKFYTCLIEGQTGYVRLLDYKI